MRCHSDSLPPSRRSGQACRWRPLGDAKEGKALTGIWGLYGSLCVGCHHPVRSSVALNASKSKQVFYLQVFQRRGAAAVPVPAEAGMPPNTQGFVVSSEPSVCDALLAVSALINASGPAVGPFAGEVAELLLLQLRHQHEPQETAAAPKTDNAESDSSTPDELQAARICIELVGDLSRALGPDFGGVADPLLHQFYQLLKVN